MRFVGVKEAKPLALCKQGANQHSHVLMTKSLKSTTTTLQPETVLEITDMDKTLLKKSLLWDDITKSHVAALDDAVLDTFIAKSAEDQKTEAHAAKAKADQAAADAAAQAAGKTAKEIDMEKRLSDQAVQIETLKAQNEARDIEKRAAAEFSGYPGGVAEAVKMLTDIKGQPQAVVDAVEKSMKDRIEANKILSKSAGYRAAEGDKSATPAADKVEAAVKAYAAEKKLSFHAAYADLADDPAHAADFQAARDEAQELADS